MVELPDLSEFRSDAAAGASEPVDSSPQEIRLKPAPEGGLARSLEKRRLQVYLFLIIADVTLTLACFFAIAVTYFGTISNWRLLDSGMVPAYLMLPMYLTIAIYNGTYSRKGLTEWKRASFRAASAVIVSAALLNLFAFFAKINTDFSRFVFTTGSIASIGGLFVIRYLVARFLRHRWGPSAINCLVIHAGGPAFSLPNAYHIDAEHCGLDPNLEDPHALDRLSRYVRNMDEVVVSCQADSRVRWARALKSIGIHGEVVDGASRDIGALGVVHRDEVGISALLVSRGHLGIRARAAKRLLDLALTVPAVILLSPLFAIVALLIKLEDGGPILFVQRRMGRGNRFFSIYKFRSMREADDNGDRSASKDDDRVTRIGRFIRRTSIDELPQLLNVIKGDMSLVGPRPHALGSTAGSKLFWQVDARYWQRHSLRPGITGLAQIRGLRGATDTEHDLANRLEADLEYLSGWSVWRDLLILAATCRVLVHDRAF